MHLRSFYYFNSLGLGLGAPGSLLINEKKKKKKDPNRYKEYQILVSGLACVLL